MKKYFLPLILLILSACSAVGGFGCMAPSDYDKNTAESYYHTLGTKKVSNRLHNQIRKSFGCYYRGGDDIYAYQSFWGVKYILVRDDEPITYIDGK